MNMTAATKQLSTRPFIAISAGQSRTRAKPTRPRFPGEACSPLRYGCSRGRQEGAAPGRAGPGRAEPPRPAILPRGSAGSTWPRRRLAPPAPPPNPAAGGWLRAATPTPSVPRREPFSRAKEKLTFLRGDFKERKASSAVPPPQTTVPREPRDMAGRPWGGGWGREAGRAGRREEGEEGKEGREGNQCLSLETR